VYKIQLPGIVPVYPTVKGVNQRAWRDSIQAALESVWDKIPEPLPRTLLERFSLVPLALALRHAHFPFSRDALELAPEAVNESAESAGWMAEIEIADEAELKNLMTQAQYDDYLKTL